MKSFFLLLYIFVFVLGCGVMNNPKEEEVERSFGTPMADNTEIKDKINLPKKFFVAFPKALYNKSNKTKRVQKSNRENKKRENIDKSKHPRWYN